MIEFVVWKTKPILVYALQGYTIALFENSVTPVSPKSIILSFAARLGGWIA